MTGRNSLLLHCLAALGVRRAAGVTYREQDCPEEVDHDEGAEEAEGEQHDGAPRRDGPGLGVGVAVDDLLHRVRVVAAAAAVRPLPAEPVRPGVEERLLLPLAGQGAAVGGGGRAAAEALRRVKNIFFSRPLFLKYSMSCCC